SAPLQDNQRGSVSPGTLPAELALDTKATQGADRFPNANTQELAKNVIREIILPVLEKEVNEGKNFAALRQVFQSLILAGWYKNALKTSLLNQVYANTNKVEGITISEKDARERVYAQYMEAYRKGVFNYIKEDTVGAIHESPLQQNPTDERISRKYFSGGIIITDFAMNPEVITEAFDVGKINGEHLNKISFSMQAVHAPVRHQVSFGLDRVRGFLDQVKAIAGNDFLRVYPLALAWKISKDLDDTIAIQKAVQFVRGLEDQRVNPDYIANMIQIRMAEAMLNSLEMTRPDFNLMARKFEPGVVKIAIVDLRLNPEGFKSADGLNPLRAALNKWETFWSRHENFTRHDLGILQAAAVFKNGGWDPADFFRMLLDVRAEFDKYFKAAFIQTKMPLGGAIAYSKQMIPDALEAFARLRVSGYDLTSAINMVKEIADDLIAKEDSFQGLKLLGAVQFLISDRDQEANQKSLERAEGPYVVDNALTVVSRGFDRAQMLTAFDASRLIEPFMEWDILSTRDKVIFDLQDVRYEVQVVFDSIVDAARVELLEDGVLRYVTRIHLNRIDGPDVIKAAVREKIKGEIVFRRGLGDQNDAVAKVADQAAYGGIDLGAGNYLKVIARDAVGMPQFDAVQVERLQQDLRGFVPVPVGVPQPVNLRPLLGLSPKSGVDIKLGRVNSVENGFVI
ncbi:MAG: hypothetical protein V2A70_01540, partial [Candidatus Omnitrophota bacterium]